MADNNFERTILVTTATGQQGTGVVKSLLAAGFHVKALTRDTSSEPARSLASWGATVVQGDFTSPGSLRDAVEGCSGIFLNSHPLSPSGALTDAQAILSAIKVANAAGAATIRHVIYTSVSHLDWYRDTDPVERDRLLAPGGLIARNYIDKLAIEAAVQELADGEEGTRLFPDYRWTLFRPAMFMGNYLLPTTDFMYPELGRTGELHTAIDPDNTPVALVDPADVGKFAAAAFANPENWHGRTFEIASENTTVREVAGKLGAAAGKEVKIVTLEGERLEQMIKSGKYPVVEAHSALNARDNTVDIDKILAEGFALTSFDQYLGERRELAQRSVGSAASQ